MSLCVLVANVEETKAWGFGASHAFLSLVLQAAIDRRGVLKCQ